MRTTIETSEAMLGNIGVPEEEDKNKEHEKILEEIIVETFPKMGQEIARQVQETRESQTR